MKTDVTHRCVYTGISGQRNNQQGATLIAGLIFLLILSIVGMAAMDITTVDVKVVANSKDRQLAFNAADSQLFQGGEQVIQAVGKLDANVTGFSGNTHAGDNDWWADSTNWADVDAPGKSDFAIEEFIDSYQDSGGEIGVDDLTVGVGPGSFFYEYPVKSKARGPGGAEVVLSSLYVKQVFADEN